MFKKIKKNREGLFTGIAMAYTILLLHLLLLAGLGLVVVFLTGIANYMFLIVLFGMGGVALSGYLFFRRLRKEGKSLGETLRSPDFHGRELTISLFGGMATMRLGSPDGQKALPDSSRTQPAQLEDPEIVRIREIQALAELFEKKLITDEEYFKAKQRLFKA
jgi:hypothetical protein